MTAKSFAKKMCVRTLASLGVNVDISDLSLRRRNGHLNLTVFNRDYLTRYYEDDPFKRLYWEAMTKTNSSSRDSFAKQCRYYGLYQMARRVLRNNVPGDFAECGCWRGHSAVMLAELIHAAHQERSFHIFDSFEGGLSDKSEEDKRLLAAVEPKSVRREKEAFYSTEAEVSRALSGFPFVSLHKGWIPERFVDVEGSSFAFVNLDLDLYQPIRDSLHFFYPRLSPGGIIVVDDYGTTGWPGVKTAVDQFLAESTVTLFIETLGSIVIVK